MKLNQPLAFAPEKSALEEFRSSLSPKRVWRLWCRTHLGKKIAVATSLLLSLAFWITLVVLDDLQIFLHLGIVFLIGTVMYTGNRFLTLYIAQFLEKQYLLDFPQELAALSVFIFWALLALFIPIEGLVKMLFSMLCLFSLFDLVYPSLHRGAVPAIIVSGLFLALYFDILQVWQFFVIFILFLLLLAFRTFIAKKNLKEGDRRFKISKPIVQGMMLAPATFLLGAIVVYWVLLSMNPFWQTSLEVSKYETLQRLDHTTSLDVIRLVDERDVDLVKNYPIVVKPNVCTTSSRNVKICRNKDCLATYLKEKSGSGLSFIAQKFSNGTEGVVFFYKYPYLPKGSIKKIGIRDKARQSSNDDLNANYFFHKEHSVTPELVDFFNKVADRIPGYYGGRFDVMFDSLDSASKGKGIHILEANIFPLDCIAEKGVGFDKLLRRIRTNIMEGWIGISVILGGYHSSSLHRVVNNVPRLVERYFKCDNPESLFAIP